MKTLIRVVRVHLTAEVPHYVALWYLGALILGVVWVVFSMVPVAATAPIRPDPGPVMGMVISFGVSGLLSITRSLPFALAFGVARRDYYTGTALLAVGLAVVYGGILVVVQVIENATNGWGIALEAFHAPWILQGPWYQSWWTFSASLGAAFLYGMWYGIVYWRWRLPGLLAFSAVQIGILLGAVVVVFKFHGWHSIWQFFTRLGPSGLTDAIAVLAIILLIGGLATVRRVTV